MLPDDAHSAFRVVSLSSCCSTVMTNQTCHRLFGSVRDHTTSHWSSALLRSTLPSSSFPFTLPLPPFPLREPKQLRACLHLAEVCCGNQSAWIRCCLLHGCERSETRLQPPRARGLLFLRCLRLRQEHSPACERKESVCPSQHPA